MNAIFQVLIGGAIGAVSRYGMGFLLPGSNGGRFPWSTFIVNLAGCFVTGLVMGLAAKGGLNKSYLPLLVTGFLGGFTTFSSFGFETVQLFQNKQVDIAVYYLLGTNIAGILLVAAGYWLVSRSA